MEALIACVASEAPLARTIADRLSLCTRASVRVEQLGKGLILEALEARSHDGCLLLLLSAEAVPAKFQLSDWEDCLAAQDIRLGCLVASDCRYPKLLERGKFWRWQETATLRTLTEWVMGFGERPAFRLARVEGFKGRDEELEELYGRLVDQPGQVALVNEWPSSGKTALAQHFARVAEGQFEAIMWLDCTRRRPLFPVDVTKRTLLVLDDVTQELEPLPGGKVSVLATARRPITGLQSMVIEAGDYPTGALVQAGRRNLYSVAVHGKQGGVPLDAEMTLFRAARDSGIDQVPEALLRHFTPHLLAEAEEAMYWAVEEDAGRAKRLAVKVFDGLRDAGRLDEAFHFLGQFRGYEAVREYCECEIEGRAKHIEFGEQIGLFG